VPRSHVAPRHRSSRSLKQKLGRLAGDVAGLVPASAATRTAVIVGAAGIAAGVGAFTFQPQQVPHASGPRHSPQVSLVMNEADSLLKARGDTAVHRTSRDAV
jgi:hypothetical protein